MRPLAALLLLILPAIVAPVTAGAGALADLEVHDATTGRILPINEHRGRLYVCGEPGHRYELRLRSRTPQRVLAVTSVDGVNVVSGETAATGQRGYVVDPWDSVSIEGWRKSMEEVATFFFTSLPDSYAAQTGRPDDVGVIGVALFREQPRLRRPYYLDDKAAVPEAPAANAESAQRRESLGTGHGARESSPAQYVDFRRASTTPDETITVYYDSYRNLVAQGVLPRKDQLAKRDPQPFPAGFVPDP